MKKLIYITIAIIPLFLASCNDGNPVGSDDENSLLGTWVNSSTLDGGIDMDITIALATSTFSTETVLDYPISDDNDLSITITCQTSGEWSSTDTEITFSEGTMSCDNLDEDIETAGYTGGYVLYEDTLTLTEIDGEERVYTRQ